MRTFRSFLKATVTVLCIMSFSVVFAGAPTWTRVNYTNTTAFVGEVQINFYDPAFPITVEVGDYIGAFVNGECRMIAQVFAYNSKLYVSSVIHGGDLFDPYPSNDPLITNSLEEIEFKVWDNSASAEINKMVKGTLKVTPGGEVLDYIIGKPNTVSALASLTVSGVTYAPVFSPTQTSYTVSMAAGSTLPLLAAYTTTLADSRATVAIVPATDFTTNNITTITVTAEDGTKTVYTITYTEQPCAVSPPTVVSPVEYCQGAVASPLTASGTGLKWYNQLTGGTALASAPTPTTSQVGSTTYYVSQTTTCESARASIVVTIKATPAAPIASSNSPVCAGATLNLSASTITGATYLWAGPGAYSSTQQNPTLANATTAMTGTYSVTATVNGCVSPAGTVAVTVNPIPSAPIASSNSPVCAGATLNLSASTVSGATYSWIGPISQSYSSTQQNPTLANAIASMSGTYSVVATVNGCFSPIADVEVTVNPIPATPITASNVSVAIGAAIPTLSATASGTITWYSSTNAVLATGTSYATGINTSSASSTIYYVSNTVNGCESDKVPVTVSVSGCLTSLPAFTTTSYAVCEGAAMPSITGTGKELKWYSDASLQNLVYTGFTYQPSAAGVWYVTNTDVCASPSVTITVSTVAKPTIAISPIASICEGSATTVDVSSAVTASAGTIVYSVGKGSISSNGVVTLAGAGMYQIAATITGTTPEACTAQATGSFEVKATPLAPIASNVSVSVGAASPTLSATASGNITWYSFTNAVLATGTSYATEINTATSSTTLFYVSNTVNGCESEKVPVTVSVSGCLTSLPAFTSISYAVCEGAAMPSITGTGKELKWYSDASLQNLVYTGFTYQPTAAGVWYVTNTDVCASQSVTITVSTVAKPTIAISPIASICEGSATTVDVSSAVTASAGTIVYSVGKGSISSNGVVTLAGAGMYQIAATITGTTPEACTAQATGSFEVKAKPASPITASNVSVAIGAASPTLSATASGTITWYSSTNAVLATGASYATGINTSSASSTLFYVSNTVNGCESEKVPVTVSVSGCLTSLPAFTTTSYAVCEGAAMPSITGTGKELKWYSDASLQNLVYTGFTYQPSAAGVWYVTNTDVCASPSVTITVSQTPKSVKPTALDIAVCQGQTIPTLTAVGENLIWYNSLHQVISAPVNPSAEGTYYVTQNTNGCESDKQSVTVSIKALPSAPNTQNVEVVAGQTVPSLTAQGTDLTWYETQSLQNGVKTQSFNTQKTAPGEYTYFVTQTVNGCESAAATITLTITCALSAPTVVKVQESVCQGTSFTFTAMPSAGNTIVWTNSANQVVSNESTYTTSLAGTYQVKYVNAQCESPATEVVLYVKPLPQQPVIANASVCEGQQGSLVSAVNAKWYAQQSDITPIHTGFTFAPSVTQPNVYAYYVSQIENGCESAKSTVNYTIVANPTGTVNDVTVVYGAAVPALSVVTAAQNTVVWYAEDKTTVLGTGTSYNTGKTEIGVYTYYVEVTNANSCKSAKLAATLQITDCNLLAPQVNVSQAEVCYGNPNPQFQATGTGSIKWYADAQLTQLIASTSAFVPANTEPGTYTYYAVQQGTCVSPSKSASFKINALPTPEIFAPSTVYSNDAPVLITVSPLGGSLLGQGLSGNTFVPSSVAPGYYTISYTFADLNQCSKVANHVIQVIQVTIVDPSQLGDTIALALAVYNANISSNQYTTSAKIDLNNAITIASFYYDNYSSFTNDDMYEQTMILSQAIKDFYASKISTVDVSALIIKIEEANTVFNSNLSNQGSNPGQYPSSSFVALQNQIEIAQALVSNPPSTQVEVTNAIIILENAIQTFLNSQNPAIEVTGISVTETLVKLTIGDQYTPTVSFAPVGASGDIQWISSNTAIASVIASTGKITAVSKGITSITGTLMSNPSISVSIVVQVSGIPQLVAASMNNLGNQIILEFSEPMSMPSANVYQDLTIAGVNPAFYTITGISLDPNNATKIIFTLGSYIDNPSSIVIDYAGSSITSQAGAGVPSFTTSLSVDLTDIVEANIFVYPTQTVSKVTIEGLENVDVIVVVAPNGQVVARIPVTASKQVLDVNTYAQGLYNIIILKNNQVVTKASFVKK